MPPPTKRTLQRIYDKLFSKYGPQDWWPGETRLEIIVGAILTQNTNWKNVEKAIANIRRSKKLSLSALHKIPHKQLAGLIKPSGYFNIKAKRLKNFVQFVYDEFDGKLSKMARLPLDDLRDRLLSVNGVGPETADSILLYAFDKPIFVVDAYTKRIFYRHGLVSKKDDYDRIQRLFHTSLKTDRQMFNEYHALIVRLGKDVCRPKPLCGMCPTVDLCLLKGIQK